MKRARLLGRDERTIEIGHRVAAPELAASLGAFDGCDYLAVEFTRSFEKVEDHLFVDLASRVAGRELVHFLAVALGLIEERIGFGGQDLEGSTDSHEPIMSQLVFAKNIHGPPDVP